MREAILINAAAAVALVATMAATLWALGAIIRAARHLAALRGDRGFEAHVGEALAVAADRAACEAAARRDLGMPAGHPEQIIPALADDDEADLAQWCSEMWGEQDAWADITATYLDEGDGRA